MASHRASNNSMVSSLETQTAIIDQVLREGVSPPDREPELQKNKKNKIAKSGSSGAKTSDVFFFFLFFFIDYLSYIKSSSDSTGIDDMIDDDNNDDSYVKGPR